mgnify:CR=1 FL=1
MKKFFLTLYLLVLVFVGLCLFYYLPSTQDVHLVGTEVKREIRDGVEGEQIKDIRYVVARAIPSGKTLMYRNEDMPWPPYFKFDSGDLSGKVMNIKEYNPDTQVLITYYGLRVPFLSLYPNITKIQKNLKKEDHLPIFNWIVLSIFSILYLLGLFLILRKLRARKNGQPATKKV